MSAVAEAVTLNLRFQRFYQNRSIITPVTKEVIEQLIQHEVFDPQYNEHQNGLRGIYEEQLRLIREEDWQSARPITCMYVAYRDEVPVGVALARLGPQGLKRDLDHILHVYVKPEHRRHGIGTQLIYRIKTIATLPGLAMEETEFSKRLLRMYQSITPLRRPTPLDLDLARCLRTLDYTTDWTNADGSILCTGTILNTLKAQDELIKQLRKQINPHDNSIPYPS